MLVTSGPIELKVADPDLAMEFLRRPKEFRQTLIGSAVMRIFGDNLITSDGEHWARQRKLIASNINEKISDTVFKESRRQAREMMEVYGSENGGVTDNYAEGLKGIAINVLGVAGYGMSRTWKESLEKQEPLPGFQLTYIEATRLAVDHIVEASIFPAWLFLLRFMPKKVQELGYAVKEFPAHTQNMLDQERKKPSEKVNIMNMLVKESDAVQGGDVEKEGEKGRAGLTEDEIMGNLFVFTAAGFDTTANTMGYAMTELAAHPQWQGWMAEEIDEVLAGKAEELEYNEVFPRLVRVLAVMVSGVLELPSHVSVRIADHDHSTKRCESSHQWSTLPKKLLQTSHNRSSSRILYRELFTTYLLVSQSTSIALRSRTTQLSMATTSSCFVRIASSTTLLRKASQRSRTTAKVHSSPGLVAQEYVLAVR